MTLDPSLFLGVGLGVAVVETLRWALAPKCLPADLRALVVAQARAAGKAEAKAECDAGLAVLGRRLRAAEAAIAEIVKFEAAVGDLVASATGGVPGAALDLDLDLDLGDEPFNFDPREN